MIGRYKTGEKVVMAEGKYQKIRGKQSGLGHDGIWLYQLKDGLYVPASLATVEALERKEQRR